MNSIAKVVIARVVVTMIVIAHIIQSMNTPTVCSRKSASCVPELRSLFSYCNITSRRAARRRLFTTRQYVNFMQLEFQLRLERKVYVD